MDAATINLWLEQAERDGVISPGFRPQVERKLLALTARLAGAEAEMDRWRLLLRNVLEGLDEFWIADDDNAEVVRQALEAANGGRDATA